LVEALNLHPLQLVAHLNLHPEQPLRLRQWPLPFQLSLLSQPLLRLFLEHPNLHPEQLLHQFQ
jgi:hypothetical protein